MNVKLTLCERWAARVYSRNRDKLPFLFVIVYICGTCAAVTFACAIGSTVVAFLAFAEFFVLLAIAHSVLFLLFALMGLSQLERCGFIRLLDTKDEEIRSLKKMRDELLHKLNSEPDAFERHGEPLETQVRQ